MLVNDLSLHTEILKINQFQQLNETNYNLLRLFF